MINVIVALILQAQKCQLPLLLLLVVLLILVVLFQHLKAIEMS